MSQQNIYQVQLLNDLHNHFPDILYNPGRFRNIQDFLEYIRQVADTSPYTRGQAIYNNRQAANARAFSARQQTTIPIYQPVQPIQPLNTIWTQPITTVVEDTIPTTRIRVASNNATNATTSSLLMNTLLGSMFGDLFNTSLAGDAGIQGFLNQRVQVYPTEEEIDRATTVHRCNSRQDDICAICQEEIVPVQEFRTINHCNHYFHKICIDMWFTTNVHCPTCRHDIREVSETTRNTQGETNTTETTQNNPPPVPDNYRRTDIHRNNDY